MWDLLAMNEDKDDIKGKGDSVFQSGLSPRFPTAKRVIILEPDGGKKAKGSGRKRKRGSSYYENVKERDPTSKKHHAIDYPVADHPNDTAHLSNGKDRNLWMYYSHLDASRTEGDHTSQEYSFSDVSRNCDSKGITTDENENLLKRKNTGSSSCMMCGLDNAFGLPCIKVAI